MQNLRELEYIYNQFFNKKSLILFLIAVLPIIYQSKVESFLKNYIVQPFLSDFPSNTSIDVIFIIVNVLIAIYYLRKLYIKYIASITIYLIFATTTNWYIFYRFFDSFFGYTSFSFSDQIFYADTILIAFFLHTVLIFINQISYIKNKRKKGSLQTGFYSDNPIIDEKDDLLGRGQYAEKLAHEIEKTHHPKSFAVGIIGRWGSGKTSFLNMVKSSFKSSGHIIVDFNPWNSSNSKLIIQDFFKTLKVNVGKYSSSLSNQFIEYSEKLITIDSNLFTKVAKVGLGFLKKEQTAYEKYEEINKTIQNLNRKIIVFIDDLDRLDKDEIIEVIKLIRNTANFFNTVFVVAYDRDYVLNAIKDLNEYNRELFLEKIFQLEITLPHFEEIQVKNRLKEYLFAKIITEESEELKEELERKMDELIFPHSLPDIPKTDLIDTCICTIRDATRFANSFLFSYQQLKGEVLFRDLFNIELIRMKFPTIYTLLHEQKANFFIINASPDWRENIGYTLKKENNNSETVLEKYLNEKPNFVSKDHIHIVINGIKNIFRDQVYEITRDDLSIIYPSNFDRYFAFRLFEGNLSEVEFSNYRKKSENEFIERIKYWAEDKDLEWPLRRKFKRITGFDNKEDYEKVVKGMFSFSRNRFERSKDYHLDFNILYQYLTHENLIGTYYKKEDDFKSFVRNIFEQAEPPHLLESSFLYFIIEASNIDQFILNQNEREEYVLKYLKNYLNTTNKISRNAFRFYWNCRVKSPDVPDEKIVLQEANNLFRNFVLEKDFNGFCRATISGDYSYKIEKDVFRVNDNGLFTNLFGSDSFEDLLIQRKDGDTFLEEYHSFYSNCKKQGFEKYIDFNFIEIQI